MFKRFKETCQNVKTQATIGVVSIALSKKLKTYSDKDLKEARKLAAKEIDFRAANLNLRKEPSLKQYDNDTLAFMLTFLDKEINKREKRG